MSILKDRIRPLDPSSNQVFLEPDREADAEGGTPEPFAHPLPRTLSTPEEIITLDDDIRDALRPHVPAGRTEFELESQGGHLHTVTGTVAYLDVDAQTYMVLRGNGDGELIRVPLRDITSAHESVPSGQLHAVRRDAEGGLGTGK
jgi:hypothetical protein